MINPYYFSVGFVTLCMFIPIMCLMDIYERRVPWEYFATLLIMNAPITGYLYYVGALPLTHLVTSLAICVFAFGVWKVFGAGAFSAADRNLICCIALFFYWNPFSSAMDMNYAWFIAMLYQVKFLVYFMVVMCVMPGVIFAYNLIKGNHRNYFRVTYGECQILEPQDPYTVWEMLTKIQGGIPMIVPIASAFVMAAMWGI